MNLKEVPPEYNKALRHSKSGSCLKIPDNRPIVNIGYFFDGPIMKSSVIAQISNFIQHLPMKNNIHSSKPEPKYFKMAFQFQYYLKYRNYTL